MPTQEDTLRSLIDVLKQAKATAEQEKKEESRELDPATVLTLRQATQTLQCLVNGLENGMRDPDRDTPLSQAADAALVAFAAGNTTGMVAILVKAAGDDRLKRAVALNIARQDFAHSVLEALTTMNQTQAELAKDLAEAEDEDAASSTPLADANDSGPTEKEVFYSLGGEKEV